MLVALTLRAFGVHVGAATRAYAGFFGSSPYWLDALLALGTLYAGVLVVVHLGEPIHQALIRLLAIPISVLTFIDQRTPDGTVGIIGALFLVLGFGFQVVGAVASAHG